MLSVCPILVEQFSTVRNLHSACGITSLNRWVKSCNFSAAMYIFFNCIWFSLNTITTYETSLRTRPTFSETVMVSVGVSKLGCTELFLAGCENKRWLLAGRAADVEVTALQSLGRYQGMSSCFSRTVLQHSVLVEQWAQTHQTLFHRNSGHRTVQILTRWTTLIWATMQQGVYQTKIRNVELRQRLLKVWSSIEQDVIDTSTDQWPWRVRLKACVRLRGRHFEHML